MSIIFRASLVHRQPCHIQPSSHVSAADEKLGPVLLALLRLRTHHSPSKYIKARPSHGNGGADRARACTYSAGDVHSSRVIRAFSSTALPSLYWEAQHRVTINRSRWTSERLHLIHIFFTCDYFASTKCTSGARVSARGGAQIKPRHPQAPGLKGRHGAIARQLTFWLCSKASSYFQPKYKSQQLQ